MLYETTQNYYRTEEGALVAEFMESAFSKVEQLMLDNDINSMSLRRYLLICVKQ